MSQSLDNDDSRPEADNTQSTKPGVLTTKQRNNLLWEPYKGEIRRLYVERRRPLRQVMEEIEIKHKFKKSERNWKNKLKEWGFDKNMTSDMKFMVNKAEKRARHEGKETEFTRNGVVVPAETINQFKKPRLTMKDDLDFDSVDIATPREITYTTPRADDPVNDTAPSSAKKSANATKSAIGHEDGVESVDEDIEDRFPLLDYAMRDIDVELDEHFPTEETPHATSSSEVENGVVVPLKLPLMTFEEEWATYRHNGGVISNKTKASVNTSSNQRSGKYGITYTESLSAFSGLSLDYKALLPHPE